MKKFVSLALLTILCTTAFGLKPSREYKVLPSKYGMPYEEEKIETEDDAVLNAWFFELETKTTNWIVISGSGDGNMADYLEIVNSFMSAGYNVCTYDYRGYGTSSDFAIDPELFIYPQFIKDLNAVLDYLRKSRAITKFDLYGQNIGAGLSIGVGAQRPETRKVIADGPWLALEDIQKKYKEKLGKDIIVPFAYDKNYEPLYAFRKPKGKLKGLMAIVSPQDPLITPEDLKQIKAISQTYVVKNSPSNAENFNTDKNSYFEMIEKFLSR